MDIALFEDLVVPVRPGQQQQRNNEAGKQARNGMFDEINHIDLLKETTFLFRHFPAGNHTFRFLVSRLGTP